jgi:hypothetical protein
MQARFALSPAKLLGALAVAVLLLCGTGRATANQVGYTLDVTTNYSFAPLPSTLNNVDGGPDTGYFTVTNNGTTTFTGTIGDVALAADGTDDSFTSGALTLAPGQSVNIGIGPQNGVDDSSNHGGFNGAAGVTIQINGLINGTESVNLSVNDADIHSGSPRDVNASPSQESGAPLFSDSYVLQGGDPTGGDTGDDFETTQAAGHFEFSEAVPVPPSAILMGLGFAGLAVRSLRGKLRGLVARKAS